MATPIARGVWVLAVAFASAGAAAEVPPSRDPAVAIAQEFAAARAADSAAALILFIARHPQDPAADAARRALAARPAPDPFPAGGPDGAVAQAFDRARRAGPQALAAFAAAHPGHPLAAEAQRPFWRR